jgi:hypothetical protein
LWIALLALTIVLGIGSRRHGDSLPGFVATYAGDTLWATAAFLVLGLLLPRASTGRNASLALLVSVLVEVSQLDHAPWIDSIRRTTPEALLLGHGFLWGDLACYAVGFCLGVGVEVGFLPDGEG